MITSNRTPKTLRLALWLTVLPFAVATPPVSAQESPAATQAQGAAVFHYAGEAGRGEFSVSEIEKFIQAAPSGRHYVWQSGWADWKPWTDVDEFKQAVSAKSEQPAVAAKAEEAAAETAPVSEETVAADEASEPAAEPAAGTASAPETEDAAPVEAQTVATTGQPTRAQMEERRARRERMAGRQGPRRHAEPPGGRGSGMVAYRYGADGEIQERSMKQVVESVAAEPDGPHQIRNPESGAWDSAMSVPRIARAVKQGPGSARGKDRTVAEQAAAKAAKAAEAERPSAAPEKRERPAAAAARGPGQARIGTELQSGFGLGLTEGDGLDSGFELYRARTELRSRPAKQVDARLVLELVPNEDLDAGDAWRLQPEHASVGFRFGDESTHGVRLGVQNTVFGAGERYRGYKSYFFSGGDGYQDFATRFGLVAEEDIGVTYTARLMDGLRLDVQAMNGEGLVAFDTDGYKSGVARLTVDMVEGLVFSASGLYAMHDDEALRTLAHFGIEGKVGTSRVLIEGIAGQDGTTSDLTTDIGFSVSAAHDLEVTSDRIHHLTFLGRYMLYDPAVPLGEGAPDAESVMGLSTWAYWKAERKSDPGQLLGTGIAVERLIPQNLDQPVETRLSFETAWKR